MGLGGYRVGIWGQRGMGWGYGAGGGGVGQGYGVGIWGQGWYGAGRSVGLHWGPIGSFLGSSFLGSHWVLFGVPYKDICPHYATLWGHPIGPRYGAALWGCGWRKKGSETPQPRNPTAPKPHSRPTSPFIHRAGGIWGFGFLSVMCGVGWVWGLGWRGLWGGFGVGLGWLWGWV